MLARKQELNTQIQQLIDSFLLAFSLLAAHSLRLYGTMWFNLSKTIDPFRNYSWLLIVVPILAAFFLKDGRSFSEVLLSLVQSRPQPNGSWPAQFPEHLQASGFLCQQAKTCPQDCAPCGGEIHSHAQCK